eukprot:250851_1
MTNEFHFDQHVIIGGLLGLCLILIFTTLITYDITKKVVERLAKDPNEESENTSIDIRLMIYTDLFLILIHEILLSFNFIFASNEKQCSSLTKYGLFLFHIIRCLMYLIFVRRISVIYGDTIFALSRLHQHILYFVIALYSIPYISYTNWFFIDTYYDKQFGCVIKYNSLNNKIYFFINDFLEILIPIYCLYLFIFPLCKLISKQENKQLSYKLHNVMIKYFVLYSLSIFSCIILIIFTFNFSFGYNYSLIDGFINGIILILLHPTHNKLYKNYICCCIHSFCIIIFNAPIHNQKNTNKSLRIQKHNNIKISDNSPTSAPIKQLQTQKIDNNNENSMRNIIKNKVENKLFVCKPNNNENIMISITTPTPISPSSDTMEFEYNNIKSHPKILIPSPKQIQNPMSPISQMSQCNDIIILEDEEIDMTSLDTNINDHLTLNDIFSLTSFRSVESTNDINNLEELERKQSNTLRLINYESTQL